MFASFKKENLMKKIITAFICSLIIVLDAARPEQKYAACKTTCKEEKNCPDCIGDCQRTFCRTTCYRKNSGFKQSKACKDFYECKINQQDPCDPEPCLHASSDQKECLTECDIIYDLSVEKPSTNTCTDACYCFKQDTTEFIGKAPCKADSCSDCDTRCKNAFKKEIVKGVCN